MVKQYLYKAGASNLVGHDEIPSRLFKKITTVNPEILVLSEVHRRQANINRNQQYSPVGEGGWGEEKASL